MIRIKEVTKKYTVGDGEVTALNCVNLDIDDGEFVAVMGKSGSGKTTLLNVLGGLDYVDEGEIIIDNEDITDMPEKKLSVFRRKNIGFVFQFFNLIPELNAKENIIFPALLDKSKVDFEYYSEIIQRLQLQDRTSHLPGQLSGGQKQRVAIARALILKPKLLLLDEPTGNLDEESSDTVIEMLCNLQKSLSQTMVIVTHDKDISAHADRIVYIRDGEPYNGE